MNIVIISGEIVSEIEFNFIYDKNKRTKYTAIAMCKIRIENGSILDIYGYDEIADALYRNNFKNIIVEGVINSNMMVEVLLLYPRN